MGDGELLDEYKDMVLRPHVLDDCHALVWMGDLNYRVDMPDDILGTWVEEGKWGQILDKDQVG